MFSNTTCRYIQSYPVQFWILTRGNQLVDLLDQIANKKQITKTQLALAWLMHQPQSIIPIPGSTRVEGVQEAVGALMVKLSSEELQEIRTAVDSVEIKGGRCTLMRLQQTGEAYLM